MSGDGPDVAATSGFWPSRRKQVMTQTSQLLGQRNVLVSLGKSPRSVDVPVTGGRQLPAVRLVNDMVFLKRGGKEKCPHTART